MRHDLRELLGDVLSAESLTRRGCDWSLWSIWSIPSFWSFGQRDERDKRDEGVECVDCESNYENDGVGWAS